jgi:DNA-binding phage protein
MPKAAKSNGKTNGKSNGAVNDGAVKQSKPPTSFNATGGNGDVAEAERMREFLRKLAEAAPGVFHLVLGPGWAAVGARTWTGNHKHAAAAWWVELLRVVRNVRDIKLEAVEQRTGLKRQTFYYHEKQKRSPRLDSVLREADALEISVAAVVLTAELWHAGHAVPFACVLREVIALWGKFVRLFPASCGAGGG